MTFMSKRRKNMCTFIGSVRLIEIFSNVLKKSQRETITQVDANYVESHTNRRKNMLHFPGLSVGKH